MIPQDILKQHSLRITPHRCEILEYFMNYRSALKHSDLEKEYKNKIDRVSLYRILHSFSENKILCKIIDSKGTVSYVFDEHSLNDNSHFHPHYKCKTCNDVVELPELPKAYLERLKQLNIEEINILAEGVCNECEKTKKKK